MVGSLVSRAMQIYMIYKYVLELRDSAAAKLFSRGLGTSPASMWEELSRFRKKHEIKHISARRREWLDLSHVRHLSGLQIHSLPLLGFANK